MCCTPEITAPGKGDNVPPSRWNIKGVRVQLLAIFMEVKDTSFGLQSPYTILIKQVP
jgi:hypothetical protein